MKALWSVEVINSIYNGLFIMGFRVLILGCLSLSCLSCSSEMSSAPIDLGELGYEATVVVNVSSYGAQYIALAFPRGSANSREVDRLLFEGGKDIIKVVVIDEKGLKVFEENVIGAIGDGTRGWDFGKGKEIVALRKMAAIRLKEGQYVVRASVVRPDNNLKDVRAYLICFFYDPKV